MAEDRLSQEAVEVARKAGTDEADERLSQEAIEVVHAVAVPARGLSQEAVEVVHNVPESVRRLSQLAVEVVRTRGLLRRCIPASRCSPGACVPSTRRLMFSRGC